MNSEKPVVIRLSGDNILEEHCYFENTDGRVVINSMPDSVTVCLFPPFLVFVLSLRRIGPVVFEWKADLTWTGKCQG